VQEGNQVTFDCGEAKVRVIALAPDVVRVRLGVGGSFGPDFSYAVMKTDWPSTTVTVREEAEAVSITTPELRLHVSKSPCRLVFYDSQGNPINRDDPRKGMAWDGPQVRVWKVMPADEFYYGFGEKSTPLVKNGQAMTMWNSDFPAYKASTDPLYQSHPFFIGLRNGKAYGIFFDNTYRSSFDMGKESPDYYSFGAEGGELNYYFFYGPSMKKVIERYTELTGRMPLPPRWALGYQQSRWSYSPESKVRDIARNFRERRIPCDVIYLDIDYMDDYKCFTWSRENFPNPKQMVRDLAREGFKIVAIIDPGIKQEAGYWVYDQGVAGDHFVKRPDGKCFIGNVWPGPCAFPDFTRPATREWWGTLYQPLLDVGLRGFWNDMNEPSVFDTPNKTFPFEVLHDGDGHPGDHRQYHNIYGLQMARATYEGLTRLRPNERPFVLTRAGYAGVQRYAASWTADNTSTWEHLALSVPMGLNFGVSAQPFVGPDIGGFIGSPSGELYTRWLQVGVFFPFCRTHTVKGSKDQEPWSYGPEYEAINRRYIELRYRLLPYLYTEFYNASQTGVPIMRPVVLSFQENRDSYGVDDEFLLGDDLLIAPVLEEGARSRDVYLPEGEWWNYWTHERLTGPKRVSVDAPIDRLPLFVRGGAIIPMQPVAQYTDQAPIDPLTLDIYPSASSTATLYEDDGISFDYQRGEYRLVTFSCRQGGGDVMLEIGKRQGQYVPPRRSYLVKFNGVAAAPEQVLRSGKALPRMDSMDGLQSAPTGSMYDEQAKVLWVKFPDEDKAERIQIED